MTLNIEEAKKEKVKTELKLGRFKRVLHIVFVHNISLKGAALVLGILTFIILNIF